MTAKSLQVTTAAEVNGKHEHNAMWIMIRDMLSEVQINKPQRRLIGRIGTAEIQVAISMDDTDHITGPVPEEQRFVAEYTRYFGEATYVEEKKPLFEVWIDDTNDSEQDRKRKIDAACQEILKYNGNVRTTGSVMDYEMSPTGGGDDDDSTTY